MSTFMRILFRLVLVLAATVFMASLAFAGAILALGHALWCLLQGRRPQWPIIFMGPLRHMRRHRAGHGSPMPGWRRSGHGADAGVIEGNAREL
jgi:hypothetical protein